MNQAYEVAPVAFAMSVVLLLPQTVTLPDGVMVGIAGAAIGTGWLPLFEQVPFVTTTPRITVPVAPALNVIAFVAWPAVMTPLLIVQA